MLQAYVGTKPGDQRRLQLTTLQTESVVGVRTQVKSREGINQSLGNLYAGIEKVTERSSNLCLPNEEVGVVDVRPGASNIHTKRTWLPTAGEDGRRL